MATSSKPLSLSTQPIKETKMATVNNEKFDFSKLSVEDKFALSKMLEEEARKEATKEFDSTINFLAEKLKKMGRTKSDAAGALVILMDDAEKAAFLLPHMPAPAVRAKRGSKPAGDGKKQDTDSTGARPTVGGKYKDPASTLVWEKKKMGALKKPFKAALAAGHTWAQMLQK